MIFVPQMKKVLRGNHFACVEEVKQKTAEALRSVKINEFKTCFVRWKTHLDARIASNGEYFEGD